MVTKTGYDYDAVIVGSGPNGLAAAILLQQHGLSTILIEGKETIGGGLRTAQLTLPGFKHDICSAVHPLAVGSPFFKQLPLHQFGLEYITPEVAAAHPLDNGSAAIQYTSLERTAFALSEDKDLYLKLMRPLVKDWPSLATDVLAPLHLPARPLAMAKFGVNALQPVTLLAKRFKTEQAKALLAGMAAHSIQPLSNWATSAIALVLMVNAHLKGWPIPKGGSVSIANALSGYYMSIGGMIVTGTHISSMQQLPHARAVLFDLTPKQLLQIAGHNLSAIYRWQLERYRYGMGVYKIDWALDASIPFVNDDCRKAGTLHLGGQMGEIERNERATWKGHHPQKPFVLLAQPSIFDPDRAPEGKHTAWAYCHVPNGSKQSMTKAIEDQVERFAPGFKERIIGRHTFDTQQMEDHNPNYIGGDINGGVIDMKQLFTRPALRWSPYKTSTKGIYICSSSTPPGGGVHGMCGYHAAKAALTDVFGIKAKPLL